MHMIARLGTDQTIGEMAFLNEDKAVASARVTSETAEVYRLPLSSVCELLETRPGLSKRFFKNLAITLTHRIRLRSDSVVSGENSAFIPLQETSETPSKSSVTTIVNQVTDREICSKLGIADQMLLQEFGCTLKQAISYNGSLFVFEHVLLFYAKYFGREKKDVIEISNIIDIDYFESQTTHSSVINIHVLWSKKKEKYHFRLKKEESKGAHRLVQSLWEKQRPKDDHQPEASGGLLEVPKKRKDKLVRKMTDPTNFGPTKDKHKDTTPHTSPVTSHWSSDVNTVTPTITGPLISSPTLSNADWKVLLDGAKCVSYHSAGETIVHVGRSCQRLYQISKGSCRTEHGQCGRVLSVLVKGDVFGETTFVDENPSSNDCSIVTDCDDVELLVIEGYFINVLMQTREGFSGRFYHYLAVLLSARLARLDVFD
eukprot:TRINITY_DN1274_c0_g1_i2.p1 TRINITY_DN1274_c0_g1~~TRINITY_DN1274_c0_g1_i2.p1  ORF type:complete len:428 (+),score=63.79 TRINITY_DN1274_c0_g1_i2:787-2070(+)